MKVGLRIDVDTLRGTRIGVPSLLRDLAAHDIKGTFFFSVGPDNMGRHLFRLLKPRFAWKMLRSKAASLYGWDILLRGTIGPGPIISKQCADIIKQAADADHEIGLHAWDHHQWQSKIERFSQADMVSLLTRGCDAIKDITGEQPSCFAAPGWRANDVLLRSQTEFDFAYASDCRGTYPFQPVVNGQPVGPAQIPATLPTYDELVSADTTAERFIEIILEQIQTQKAPVLTIHAEVEGIIARKTLADLVAGIHKLGHQLVPLSELLPQDGKLPTASIKWQTIPGREGVVAVQSNASC